MTETFISFGVDASAVATALAQRLTRSGIAVTSVCGGAHTGADDRRIFESLDRADKVALLVTPSWAATAWPRIALYLARAERSAAAFLAKLALLDLSDGSAMPAVLRPVAKSGIGLTPARAAGPDGIDALAAAFGLRRREVDVGETTPRQVFVVGHPGSGKSTFCALLEAGLARRGIRSARVDAYPFLQTLSRIDDMRADATRFGRDPLCEFVIKEASVFEEAFALMKSRLLSCDDVAIVELAFSEGEAMADILSSSPVGPIVHIEASLDDCIRNNAARGAILHQALGNAAEPSAVFDRRSDVHYVPPAFYERYRLEPARWEEGAAYLATRFAERYRRLGNAEYDLSRYLESCRALIDTTLLPILAAPPYPSPPLGID